MYRSIALICTGEPFFPSTQCPSHWFSCGQTWQQASESGLLSNSSFPAFAISLSSSSRIASRIGVRTGQPMEHIGVLHCRQRRASSMTCLLMCSPRFPPYRIQYTPSAPRRQVLKA